MLKSPQGQTTIKKASPSGGAFFMGFNSLSELPEVILVCFL